MTTCRKFQFPHLVCIAYVPHQKKPPPQLPDTIQQRNKAKKYPNSANNLHLTWNVKDFLHFHPKRSVENAL